MLFPEFVISGNKRSLQKNGADAGQDSPVHWQDRRGNHVGEAGSRD